MKNQKGITLVALVITVIVLLILAGTAITIAINGGDIFTKANTAKGEWNNGVQQEETSTKNVMNSLNEYYDDYFGN